MDDKEYFICRSLVTLMKKTTCNERRVRKYIAHNGEVLTYSNCNICDKYNDFFNTSYTLEEVLENMHRSEIEKCQYDEVKRPSMHILDTIFIKLDNE